MVENFSPRLVRMAEFELKNGSIEHKYNDFEYSYVEKLLNADTDKKLKSAAAPYFDLFGYEYTIEEMKNLDEWLKEPTVNNIRSLRSVLIWVLEVLNISKKDKVTLSDLNNSNILVVRFEDTSDIERIKNKASSVISAGSESVEMKYLANLSNDVMTSHALTVISGKQYISFLEHAVLESKIDADFIPFPNDETLLNISLGLFNYSNQGFKDCAKKLVDTLFTIHLTGIKTISVNGGEEARESTCGTAAIWWTVLDELRDGRLGLCEACSRPYIAKRERGTKRRFCSDACRQWAKNHPGKTRKK